VATPEALAGGIAAAAGAGATTAGVVVVTVVIVEPGGGAVATGAAGAVITGAAGAGTAVETPGITAGVSARSASAALATIKPNSNNTCLNYFLPFFNALDDLLQQTAQSQFLQVFAWLAHGLSAW